MAEDCSLDGLELDAKATYLDLIVGATEAFEGAILVLHAEVSGGIEAGSA